MQTSWSIHKIFLCRLLNFGDFRMRTWGALNLMVGALLMFPTLAFEISVWNLGGSPSDPLKVNNIGLISDRQMQGLVGAAMFIAGSVMLAVGILLARITPLLAALTPHPKPRPTSDIRDNVGPLGRKAPPSPDIRDDIGPLGPRGKEVVEVAGGWVEVAGEWVDAAGGRIKDLRKWKPFDASADPEQK